MLDQAGEYKGITIGDPKKEPFPIHSITTYSGSQGDASGGAATGGKGAHKSGFIVAGESGRIRVFVKSDADPKKPYVRVDTSDDLYPDLKHYKSDKKDGERDTSLMDRMVYDDIDIHKVTALSLAPSEDQLVFTTSSGQIIKVAAFNLERPNEDQKVYEHLISSFHSK